MIWPRYELTIFCKLQALQGWHQTSKLKASELSRNENVHGQGRPKGGISDFLAFLGYLGHHFQKFRGAAAQSNSLQTSGAKHSPPSLGSGGPKGKNPGSNISYDREILN